MRRRYFKSSRVGVQSDLYLDELNRIFNSGQKALNSDDIVVLLQSRCMVWEQELYNQFDYKTLKSFFHTFDTDVSSLFLRAGDQDGDDCGDDGRGDLRRSIR